MGFKMSGPWVKWHLSALDNELFYNDWTAWHIFEYLCLMAYKGKPQGTVVTSRYKIEKHLGGNHSTIYKALKRLERHKMVTISVTGRKSVINICNWEKYQSAGNHSGNSSVTKRGPNGNTLNKNKKENSTNVLVETQSVYDHYLEAFKQTSGRYKLTDKRRLKLKARLRDAGKDMLLSAIDNTAASDWHMGDNDRGWRADLDYIIRSYEQVERLANLSAATSPQDEKTAKLIAELENAHV